MARPFLPFSRFSLLKTISLGQVMLNDRELITRECELNSLEPAHCRYFLFLLRSVLLHSAVHCEKSMKQ